MPLSQLPAPAAKRIALRVNTHAERALRQGHPWIFDQSITEQSHPGAPGDLAVIFDAKRRFLAIGLYDPTSAIRVRILQSREPANIDAAWFLKRLVAANLRRKALVDAGATDGYRLVHGENDGLPGLVVDRYAETLVLKIYSPAWVPHLAVFCAALALTNPAERVILRLSRSLMLQTEFLYGLTDGSALTGNLPDGVILFQENGLTFECDPQHGQKTGFFLDQRENRERVERLAQGKTVLNVFAYTGGFSLYAARGGATQVTSLDLSAPALLAATRNFEHNLHIFNVQAAIHETITADAFEALARMADEKRLFDMVILDPPMFAQSHEQISAGLAAYSKLTKLGLGVLRAGGKLVQASCSSRISAEDFFEGITQAAGESRRRLKQVEHFGHGIDHPVAFAEGAYLKCLFATA